MLLDPTMRAAILLLPLAALGLAVPASAEVVHPCNVTDLFHLHVLEAWDGVTTRVVGAGEVVSGNTVGEGLGTPKTITAAQFQGAGYAWRIETPGGVALASGVAGQGIGAPIANPHGGLCLFIDATGPFAAAFAFTILTDDPY